MSGHLKLKTENRTLREKIKSKLGFGSIVGRAPEMEKLYRIIGKAAHSSHPVLILGESGTGKEMVARSIHFSGPFRDKPFIPVDCGSLVPTLIESELFGYVKGAFTGAVQSRDGLLAIAEGGTVFLDEVGELPVDLQAKLLRAIQEREIRPVGSTKRIAINVRILAATNRDLEQAVAQGTFRRDLYFRLNVLSLKIPPLRDRRQDIPLLTGYFLERLSRAAGHERTLSDDAMKALLAYDWPGNVRELENCLERACAFTSGPRDPGGRLAQRHPWRSHPSAAWRQRQDPDHAHGGTGEADHPEHDRAAQRRQAAGGANAGHRQDHAVPQAEGVRGAGLDRPEPRGTGRPRPVGRAKLAGSCPTRRRIKHKVPPLRSLRCAPVGMTEFVGATAAAHAPQQVDEARVGVEKVKGWFRCDIHHVGVSRLIPLLQPLQRMLFLSETGVQSCAMSKRRNIVMSRLADQIVKPGLHSAFVARHASTLSQSAPAVRVSPSMMNRLLPLRDGFLVHALAVVGVCQPEMCQC